MKKIAAEVGFDISRVDRSSEADRQTVANLGTAMLFAGSVDMASKGQIPTSFIYRAIIRKRPEPELDETVSVVSLWEIPELNRFIAFTDTGVNIKPDDKAKAGVIRTPVLCLSCPGIIPDRRLLSFPDCGKSEAPSHSYEMLVSLSRWPLPVPLATARSLSDLFGAIFLGQKGPGSVMTISICPECPILLVAEPGYGECLGLNLIFSAGGTDVHWS